MTVKYRVELWESERGWGQSHILDKDFDTLEEAQEWKRQENAKNNLSQVPDYYIYAKEPYRVIPDLDPPRI